MKTTSAQRMQKLRDEARAKGLVRYGDKYVTPEQKEKLKRFADKISGGSKK